ncbi:MAG: hypothetical protein R3B07_23385 [Polyangiaceae bacterium]
MLNSRVVWGSRKLSVDLVGGTDDLEAQMNMTRGQFLRMALIAGTATLGTSLVGCGGDDGGDGEGGSGGTGGSGNGGSGNGGSGNGGSAGQATGGSAGNNTAGTGGGGGASCEASIVGNHGHELVVTQEDIDAGVDKTYDITGAALHSHSVTVTAADFATLAGGGSVTVTSTDAAAHNHSVTVTC